MSSATKIFFFRKETFGRRTDLVAVPGQICGRTPLLDVRVSCRLTPAIKAAPDGAVFVTASLQRMTKHGCPYFVCNEMTPLDEYSTLFGDVKAEYEALTK